MAVVNVRSREPGGEWSYPYEAQPKQAKAHRLWAHERLFGGAAGGGKTEWLLAECLAAIFRYGVDAIILRRTLPELQQSGGIEERLISTIPRTVGRYHGTKHRWTFRNGGHLDLGHLRTDADVARYMGGQYGVIAFDQVEAFTEWQYRRMSHPLRVRAEVEAQGFTPYKVATANPGGLGHSWVKARWIDPAPDSIVWQPRPTNDEPDPVSRCFVQSFLWDNKYLGAGYRRQLESLPEDDRRALLLGDWDVYAGARFGKVWRRPLNVAPAEAVPVPAGAAVPRALGVDYGDAAPFAALWGAVVGRQVIVYRELYKADMTATAQAQWIRSVERPDERGHGRPLPTYIDPSTWRKDPNEKRESALEGVAPRNSIAWHYHQAGVPTIPANNDRHAGTALIADLLRVRHVGHDPALQCPLDRGELAQCYPGLVIGDNCPNLIRTLPGIPRDPHDPELYDTRAEDHAVDALRYLLMGLVGRRPPAEARQPRHPQERNRTESGNLKRRGF